MDQEITKVSDKLDADEAVLNEICYQVRYVVYWFVLGDETREEDLFISLLSWIRGATCVDNNDFDKVFRLI